MLLVFIGFFLCSFSVLGSPNTSAYAITFPTFNDSSYFVFTEGYINFGALQVTPDSSATGASLANLYGRVLLNRRFTLWKRSGKQHSLASFNASFVLRIDPKSNGSGGEGIAFIITNAMEVSLDKSYGGYLGLFNAKLDGNPTNRIVAVEFDTVKTSEADDPDDNHVGIDVNSIKSVSKVSLTPMNITLKSNTDISAWIMYDGDGKQMSVYVNSGTVSTPSNLLLSVPLDLSDHLLEDVYFGFSASTGNESELNCIRSWNLTVQNIGSEKREWSVVALAVGVPLAVVVFLGVGLFFFLWRRRYSSRGSMRMLDRVLTESTGGPRKFRLKDIRKATQNFDKKCKLGQGGFGSVYKGNLANVPVAVKRVAENSNQGIQEFLAEVMIISKLRHKNLVRLLGWCHEDGELLLIYDLMPKGSLDKWIFEKDPKSEVLDWDLRYKIVSGVASALLYLHEGCEQQVLHRDLKASNVMLDSDYNARLGDFGLARVIENDKQSYTTTAVAGTPGYLAPECFHTGRATTESDVFGFGAVALEVACGRRPRCEAQTYLVDWVWELYREGSILDAADPRLLGRFEREEMECMLLVGMACSHPNPQERPTMRQVMQILNKDASAPLMPLFKPAFVWPAPPSNMSEILSMSSSYFSTQ